MDNNETKKLNGLIELFEKGRFAELVSLCEKFVRKNPSNAIGWNLLALSHKNLGNIEKARTLFEKLLQNNPNNSILLSNLGNVYRSIGRLQDSVTCYKKAIKQDPNMFNAIEALGMSYSDLGDLKKALSCYKRNTELDKTNQLARYNVANTYRKLMRYEEAVEEFELTDHNGKPRKSAEFQGRFMLIYFGYSYCPDVCPTALQIMSNALQSLGNRAQAVQPIFITVDPGRDMPAHLKEYVKNFYPGMIGLTGDESLIKAAAKNYRIYYAKTLQDKSKPDADDYLMDHSSIIFLMDRKGRYVTHFSHQTNADVMAKTIAKQL